MEEFLTKLYSYEYFSTYLIISIIVLIILFIIILFFGKKDQKDREIEATKKLMQINEEALKDQIAIEESVKSKEERLENDTIIVPNISDINVPNEEDVSNELEENIEIPEPVLPSIESATDDNASLIDESPIVNLNEENNNVHEFEESQAFKEESEPEVIEVPKMEFPEFTSTVQDVEEPVLSKDEEKPFAFNDFNFEGNIITPEIEKDQSLESSYNEIKPIVQEEVSVPEFNFDEIIKNVEEVKDNRNESIKKGPEIFSSVYVPQKEEDTSTIVKEDDEEFELPTLKKEVIDEVKEEIDVPKLNDYNLDEISGETYNIK